MKNKEAAYRVIQAFIESVEAKLPLPGWEHTHLSPGSRYEPRFPIMTNPTKSETVDCPHCRFKGIPDTGSPEAECPQCKKKFKIPEYEELKTH